MSFLLLENRKKGFTLLELLVALLVSAVIGIIVVDSYRVSSKIASASMYQGRSIQSFSNLSTYLGVLFAMAGSAVPPEEAIKVYNNENCSGGDDFENALCGSNDFPHPMTGTDVLVIAYAEPFTLSESESIGRFAAQVTSCNSSTILFSSTSPLQVVFENNLLKSVYEMGKMFMVYDFNNPGNAFVGYINNVSESGDQINLSFDEGANLPLGDTPISSVCGGVNLKFVLLSMIVIYVDENGNLVVGSKTTGDYGNSNRFAFRTMADGVEAFDLKFYNKTADAWEDFNGDNIGKYLSARVGVIFTNYFSYKNLCTNKLTVQLLGDNFDVHANQKYSLKDPCSFYKTFIFEKRLNSIIWEDNL